MSILLFLSFLLLSCKKEAPPFLEYPEFKDIVGKWESISGELKSVEVDSKGHVSIKIDTERGEEFDMNQFRFNNNKLIIDSDTLLDRNCSKFEKGNYLYNVSFDKKPRSDTARINLGQQINDFVVLNGDSVPAPLFVRVK